MTQIEGNENQLIFAFPDREVNCTTTTDALTSRLLERADISIIGHRNRVLLHFESEAAAEELLTGGGFLLIVKGDDNDVEVGHVIVRCSSILGMTGLKLIVGQLPGLGAGVSRTANGCRVRIGNRVVINGVTLYLQEDRSHVCIGDYSIVGWGSIVTRRFDEPNVILAGIPAKVVKRGINWDRRSLNKYMLGR
ncbi:acyltransferase [Bacteroides sp. ET71]|uniref:acyltransferase n=1 Tax=Bacteroides sp. ET71 TaxID=2939421 RepID=UPI002011F28A|nr:acyltransferase [Bacteroides sp. ET71]MCL1615721.1 acyltransferase [Bacteroides sp. ET71]